jgi:wobble nucleotide-excising tRNase
MIKSVDKIKNFGLFKDFKWSSNIPNFSQYNLIYGWNYSGKTTLSRILRSIELKELHSDFQNAEFELIDDQNNKILHNDLGKSPYQFRVFNTDFVEENIHWDSQEAEPIFILGKEDIELQKQIGLKKQEIANLSDEKKNKEKEKSKLNRDVESKLTSKARELDRINPPYDKRKLRSSLEKIKSEPEKYYLSEEDVQELLETLRTSPKDRLPEICIETLPQNKTAEIKGILDRTVVSQTIERLKNNPELNDWVRKGLDLHKGKERCEFCGNTLPENLLKKYEKHFSEEYEYLMSELNTLIEDLKKYKISISFPDEKRLYPQLETEYKDIKTKFDQHINEYNKNIGELIKLLEDKVKNPFKKLAERLIHFDSDCVKNNLKKLNEVLMKHNSISDNFKNEQENAFEKLEFHYACEFNQENKYFDSRNILEKLTQEINKINRDIKKKEEEIGKIESQLSDIAKAADKINQYLRSMFGKEHIKIEVTGKNKFKILRDGSDAKNLSSGEKTAIAFSYFLTRLEDRETDISKAIVFIDDPISSLDSNHLYNTFAVIQAKLSDCHQLFVSTHNHEFFNLIKEWLKSVRDYRNKCCFYLNERITKNGDETSDIKKLPSTLLNFKSEYYFLFYKIKSFVDNPSTDYESLYQLPNIIRRFLEAFIGFKYSAGFNELQKIIDDESNRIKVNRFVQEFSHQKDLNRSLRFCDSSECRTVVDIVLKAVESKDSEHYKTLENVYHNASR